MNGDSKLQMKGFFLGWACRAGTRDFCSALAALIGPVQNIFSSLYVQFICPHRLASWAGSRAGSPVSYSLCNVNQLFYNMGRTNTTCPITLFKISKPRSYSDQFTYFFFFYYLNCVYVCWLKMFHFHSKSIFQIVVFLSPFGI